MKRLSILMAAVGASLLAASALGSVSQAPPPNTFRWSVGVNIDIDPAVAYSAESWAVSYATGAKLFNYPDAPAPRGSQLVPEVAAGYPRISRDGRTYTFRLKKSYRMNSGGKVTAKSFARSLFRTAHPRMSSPGYQLMSDIVGAEAFNKREAASLAGVRVLEPYTLQIQLKKPSFDLLDRLSTPFFVAVPPYLGINLHGLEAPIPSAGPYYVSERRSRRMILERNPFYHGPRPHRVRRIHIDIGSADQSMKRDIDRGVMDAGDVSPEAHAELGRRYGVKRQSPGRYFVNSTTRLLYLAFNHDRELFGGPGPRGNVRLKKAVNFAIDRRQLMLQFGTFGGVVSDQFLPPTMPGFRDWKLYPRRPNLGRARRLATGNLRNAKGFFYCIWRRPEPQLCQRVQAQLRAIGLDMDVRLFPNRGFWFPSRRGEAFDMTVADGPTFGRFDPGAWLDHVDGATIRPAGNVNASYFSDPTFNRRIRLARRLKGERRYAAFATLDRDLMRDAAPIAPIGYLNDRHYVSARVGCYHHHPVYGWNFGAICLRR